MAGVVRDEYVSDVRRIARGRDFLHNTSRRLIARHLLSPQAPLQAPPGSSANAVAAAAAAAASGTPQSLKLTYPETLDRIKEEFQFLQTQYHRWVPAFCHSRGGVNTGFGPGRNRKRESKEIWRGE